MSRFPALATAALALVGCSSHKPSAPPAPFEITGRVVSCWDPSDGKDYALIDVLQADGTVWHYSDQWVSAAPTCATFRTASLWTLTVRWDESWQKNGIVGVRIARVAK